MGTAYKEYFGVTSVGLWMNKVLCDSCGKYVMWNYHIKGYVYCATCYNTYLMVSRNPIKGVRVLSEQEELSELELRIKRVLEE